MNVLFLWTGNSCRSILGEATFNHLALSLAELQQDRARFKSELDRIGALLPQTSGD